MAVQVELKAYASHMTMILGCDEDVAHLLPLNHKNEFEFYAAFKSGVILCKILNTIQSGIVNVKVLN
jgi:hypothetical protein